MALLQNFTMYYDGKRDSQTGQFKIILTPTNSVTELSYLFCWKSPISSSRKQELPTSVKRPTNGHDQDLQMLKSYYGEEGVESELMRLHKLCGPSRFFFTIKEETKEDLESKDGKSRGERTFSRKGSRYKSLGELLACVETPYLTHLASPTSKSQYLECYNQHGFNPLFESSTDTGINKLKFSPPPKFKFLRDAEEKLMKKLMEAAERKCIGNNVEEKDNSFVVGESKQPHSHSTTSHVLNRQLWGSLRMLYIVLLTRKVKPCGVCRECTDFISEKSKDLTEVDGSNRKSSEKKGKKYVYQRWQALGRHRRQ